MTITPEPLRSSASSWTPPPGPPRAWSSCAPRRRPERPDPEEHHRQDQRPQGRFTIVSPKAGSYLVEGKASGFADTYSRLRDGHGQDTTGIMVRMTRGVRRRARGGRPGRSRGRGREPRRGLVDDAFMRVLGDIGDGSGSRPHRRGRDLQALRTHSRELPAPRPSQGLRPGEDHRPRRHRGQEMRPVTLSSRGAASSAAGRLRPGRLPIAGAQVKLFHDPSGRATVITEGNGCSRSGASARAATRSATRRRSSGDNPFMENLDLKDTQREINVRNGIPRRAGVRRRTTDPERVRLRAAATPMGDRRGSSRHPGVAVQLIHARAHSSARPCSSPPARRPLVAPSVDVAPLPRRRPRRRSRRRRAQQRGAPPHRDPHLDALAEGG